LGNGRLPKVAVKGEAYSRDVAERTEIERRGGETIGGASYAELLDEVRRQVRAARVRAARAVNAELIAAYWRIGHMILERQQAEGWGAKVIEQLAVDLKGEDTKGFSVRNLKYMRTFAQEPPLGSDGADRSPGLRHRDQARHGGVRQGDGGLRARDPDVRAMARALRRRARRGPRTRRPASSRPTQAKETLMAPQTTLDREARDALST